ncbi:hypothetical protein E3N88_15195 [Mikania micrantha]|uniref:Uncharacterized protein n=1 Tax=Mikania micrantha TaxID=192012 RepID=A0A5N6NXW7_9ASTR|nr:hypothetical protein E3N88_15195 [Mikania micrantha]
MMPLTIEKKPIAAIPPLAATIVYMVLGWSGVENRLLRSLNILDASKTPTATLPCGSLSFFCPALTTRSRQPVKRYKKMISDIFPRNPVEEPNDRKIEKLL